MPFLESILALFAIVDPIGNIPMFLHVSEHVEGGQGRKAFNIAVAVSVIILVVFSFAGNAILDHVFRITLADLRLAGGILLLIIAIDHLVFGTLLKSVAIGGKSSPAEIGCVPLACPMLAGPGAMVTSITTLDRSGAVETLVAIFVVFGIVWVVMRFVHPLHKILGKVVCTAFSKVMCLFIAAIGVHMIMTALSSYFET